MEPYEPAEFSDCPASDLEVPGGTKDDAQTGDEERVEIDPWPHLMSGGEWYRSLPWWRRAILTCMELVVGDANAYWLCGYNKMCRNRSK